MSETKVEIGTLKLKLDSEMCDVLLSLTRNPKDVKRIRSELYARLMDEGLVYVDSFDQLILTKVGGLVAKKIIEPRVVTLTIDEGNQC